MSTWPKSRPPRKARAERPAATNVRNREREMGKLALDAASQMLTYAGLVEETVTGERLREGERTVVVRTIVRSVKWAIRDLVALARVGDFLVRLAEEMPTNFSGVVEDAEVELRRLAEAEGLDPNRVVNEARRLVRVHNL